MSVYNEIGLLVIGSWLKKISHLFHQDILKIYEMEGMRFELSWFPVFFLLKKEKQLPVTTLANKLEISHPAVIQVLKSLHKEGLIEFGHDKDDKRKRQVMLTKEGEMKMEKLVPVWKKMEHCIAELMNQSVFTKNMNQALIALENNFSDNSLLERYKEK